MQDEAKRAQPARARGGMRLAELIAALSLAIDLGMGAPAESFLSSAVLAVLLGEACGASDEELRETYYLALLRFVGCTADQHLSAEAFVDEIAMRAQMATIDTTSNLQVLLTALRRLGAGEPPLRRAGTVLHGFAALPKLRDGPAAHCEVARRLAVRLGLGERLQVALGQIYERWDGKGQPNQLKGEAIALSARLVLLAQSVGPAFTAGGVEAAVAVVRERAGDALDPRLVRRFCAEAPRILPEAVREPVWERALAAEPGRPLWLSEDGIETAVRAIADFTDLAAPALAGHSSGVGDLAAESGRRCGLPDAVLTDLRRAGYLHDLGRVGLSAGLWQKPAALSAGEWERVRLHPYYTERILARAPGLSGAGAIAALHHERLDGSGYHRAAPAATQPPAARILAAADAYHAMTEPRPYRAALSPEAAAETLQRGVRDGRFDGEAVRGVLAAAGHRVQQARRGYPAGLSGREVEVLRLLARGCSNKQIAATLAISAKTAGHHIQHIYDKAGVSTRAAATLFAMQHDLLDTLAPPA